MGADNPRELWMKTRVALAILAILLLPEAVSAQTTVTVLGLRSATADEQAAAAMTAALRMAAESATSSGLTHSGRENHLQQLLIVFDCEEPSEQCMQTIGESLNSQRLIYGLLQPASGRDDSDYAVTLHFFNVASGHNERDLRETIPRSMSAEDMIEPASRFYMALTGRVVNGELAIRADVEGAEVLIDGEQVGTTSDEPLVLRELAPGEVTVAIRHDEYEIFERDVTIEAGQLREIDAVLSERSTRGGATGRVATGGGTGDDIVEPPPPRQRRNLAWLGWTTVGLGALMSGLGLWASLDVNSANNDEELRYNFPQSQTICEGDAIAPPTGRGYSVDEANDRCSRGRTLQTLQWVFYGVGVVAAGVGIWLLIREYSRVDDEELQSGLRLRFDPVVFAGGGALSASLTF